MSLNTCFTACIVKPFLLQAACVKVFSGVQHDFLCKLVYQPVSDVLIDVAPSSVLRLH